MKEEGPLWYLPVGQAIRCSHIHDLLEDMARGGEGAEREPRCGD